MVLSGTANDGTLGLQAIKAEGGITFAQDDTAQHEGMPHSAIASGWVDLMLPPEQIGRELARIAAWKLSLNAASTRQPVRASQPIDFVSQCILPLGLRDDGALADQNVRTLAVRCLDDESSCADKDSGPLPERQGRRLHEAAPQGWPVR